MIDHYSDLIALIRSCFTERLFGFTMNRFWKIISAYCIMILKNRTKRFYFKYV